MQEHQPVIMPGVSKVRVKGTRSDQITDLDLEDLKVQYQDVVNEDQSQDTLVHFSGIVRGARMVEEAAEPGFLQTTPEEQTSPMYELYEAWKGCQGCKLHLCRKQVVFSSGNDVGAKVLILGEAPGPEEDTQGIPFIGPTGQKLRNSLQRVGLDPDRDCYITNSVMCFPNENGRISKPGGQELLACRPRLQAQASHLLQAGTLRAILLVGKYAHIQWFHKEALEAGQYDDPAKFNGFKLKPQLGWYTGPLPIPGIKVMTVYHPSYLERQKAGESSVIHTEWMHDLEALKMWSVDNQFWNPRPIK